MASLWDKLRGRKPTLATEPDAEGLYSPPERGGPDPAPSQFNVRDTVEASGTGQSGAVAVADGVRRALPGRFVVPDGTYGTVKGVDLHNIFVAFPVEVPRSPWRHSRADEGPDYAVGDRLKAIGQVETAWGSIPNGHVVNVLDDLGDTLRVQLMLQFPKADWHNRREPELRRWGAQRAIRLVWYLPAETTIAQPRPPGRPIVLKPTAVVARVGQQRVASTDAVDLGDGQLAILNMDAVEDEITGRRRQLQVSQKAGRNPGDDPGRASLDVLGMPVSIEFFQGEERPGFGRTCPGHYGYFNDTRAMDGDSVDVLLGPSWRDDAPDIWVVEQLDPRGSGTTHQYKTLIGWKSESAVREAFLALWPEYMLGEMTSCTTEEYRDAWMPELNEIPDVREAHTRLFYVAARPEGAATGLKGWTERETIGDRFRVPLYPGDSTAGCQGSLVRGVPDDSGHVGWADYTRGGDK